MNEKLRYIATLVLCAMPLAVWGQTTQLKVATISAGAARLDNGSLVNIGQPLVGFFGSPQAGVVARAGIIGVLRQVPPPQFDPFLLRTNGNIRLSFQVSPGWTHEVEASTNLVDWVSLWMTNTPNATITFEDLDAMRYDRRFYRIVTY